MVAYVWKGENVEKGRVVAHEYMTVLGQKEISKIVMMQVWEPTTNLYTKWENSVMYQVYFKLNSE